MFNNVPNVLPSGHKDRREGEEVSGRFVDFRGERCYTISNVDKMPPFFVSLISAHDHWLFVSSNGGLTAGRVSPDSALFPYITVDKIYDSNPHTGCKTLLRIDRHDSKVIWEPFNSEHIGLYNIERHIHKSMLGNKLCFEEINHDLELLFRYSWMFSEEFGFVRQCELENLGNKTASAEILDGLQNILPAGAPRTLQTTSSYLIDAYKWTEIDKNTGLATFTLYSGITDRAEPRESLRANTVFCLGLEDGKILLSAEQINDFRLGKPVTTDKHKRGVRGAYLVNNHVDLSPGNSCRWKIVANVEQTQEQIVELGQTLKNRHQVWQAINNSIEIGSDRLARIMAAGDGFQLTAEENVCAHHYANVLFNVLRGGTFDDQYVIDTQDFATTVRHFNRDIYVEHENFFSGLPGRLRYSDLENEVKQLEDFSLLRLCFEYLPITFGRRHGDPSRPWNQFSIKLKDEHGRALLTYQGNWRDVFQNWEALCLSYPEFIENVIAKFVNASTMDGYNPYRISKEGIDWEVEDPDDPWSYIGYWGDHQIIYLLKLLELSQQFHPGKLNSLLREPIFTYANVPYRIKGFEALLEDAKNTVTFDESLAEQIEQRTRQIGADGKLVLDSNGTVYRVNLMEKLLVPLLSKLGNLVLEGGIWLNTQRPEWNDANNALVGQGLSMVTLYYLRRYVNFMQELLAQESDAVIITQEVTMWITETAATLRDATMLADGQSMFSADQRFNILKELGQAADRYRQAAYTQQTKTTVVVYPLTQIKILLGDAQTLIDHSIEQNRRTDQLYHAYNLLRHNQHEVSIDQLYPMLEGQVAVLSSGLLNPEQSVSVIEALFDSDIYRPDQDSFMLYPDRELPGFMQKNIILSRNVESIPLLTSMLDVDDRSLVIKDAAGNYRFNADIIDEATLSQRLDEARPVYDDKVDSAHAALLALYDEVFDHQSFTGRSGGMFGFEGLGCIYWHMVSKLLLAVQENFFHALDQSAGDTTVHRLGELYYRVRQGIGFNKNPEQYGAFPMDPYSHTPKHAGAQQPGMTGQVKEEILTRFGELGIRVKNGEAHIQPRLLREREFLSEPQVFRYLDVNNEWQEITVPARGLAFTWCQVPFVYLLGDEQDEGITVNWSDAESQPFDQLVLPADTSSEIFQRTGRIAQVSVTFSSKRLFNHTEGQ